MIILSICKTYERLEQSTATCENCRSKHQEENSLITILKNTVILITVTKYNNTQNVADFTMIAYNTVELHHKANPLIR